MKSNKEVIEELKSQNRFKDEVIQKLEAKVEQLQEPAPIALAFEVLPISDAVNLLCSIQANLFGRVSDSIAATKNELGCLEASMETLQVNAGRLNSGKIFKG